MTLLEVIQKSAEFLEKKGVESPRLQVELLLAHILQMPRMKLYLNFERKLNESELNSLRELVKRRGNREPLQHIVGSTSFCGLEMEVNRHVLVPRPETELLAERGWTFLKNLNTSATKALDLATGSGCIAIALAVHSPQAEIYASDISEDVLHVARRNVEKHNLTQRIQLLYSDLFSAVPRNIKFDLILSNPPYIPSAEIETLDPEVREFDPRLALDGGTDGLNFYRRLASEAGEFLQPHGKLMFEFGDGQAADIKAILEQKDWNVEAVEADYTKRERFLVANRT